VILGASREELEMKPKTRRLMSNGPEFKIHTAHGAICKRYGEWCASADRPVDDHKSREMDLAALAVPMDWEALLAASDGDFLHDISGIHAYIDRTTGELTNCFLPRFARPSHCLPLVGRDGETLVEGDEICFNLGDGHDDDPHGRILAVVDGSILVGWFDGSESVVPPSGILSNVTLVKS
jgi:hypothetical protein